MKRLNQAYRKGDAEAIGNLVSQWETSPFGAPAAATAPRPRCRPVAHAEQRLAEARDSDLARLMEQPSPASGAPAATCSPTCARTPKPRWAGAKRGWLSWAARQEEEGRW